MFFNKKFFALNYLPNFLLFAGFIPAPIIAVRTVKSELICGLAKGKFDVLNKQDPNWMRSGDYGLVQ